MDKTSVKNLLHISIVPGHKSGEGGRTTLNYSLFTTLAKLLFIAMHGSDQNLNMTSCHRILCESKPFLLTALSALWIHLFLPNLQKSPLKKNIIKPSKN